MGQDRAALVHQNFLSCLQSGAFPPRPVSTPLETTELHKTDLAEIFLSQLASRQLDRAARDLLEAGLGYYTIASSGHDGMAAIAAALSLKDMAFLHYRDAAFQIQRARQSPGQTPLWDIMLSFVASADDPIAGGRHKVLGSKALNIPPQTSTIASHLPKAVGAAYAAGIGRRLVAEFPVLEPDALIVCSFGDASLNHSTAQGAFNTAAWTAYQGIPLPLLFVCEDNGIGISTPTPHNWVRANMAPRAGLKYIACNGLDILDTYKATREAADYIRKHKKPVFLHMQCVRLYGHAGSDIQSAYLSKPDIEASEANDPLLHGARLVKELGAMTYAETEAAYNDLAARLKRISDAVITRPKLLHPDDIRASIIPPPRPVSPPPMIAEDARKACFGNEINAMETPQSLAKLLNWALTDLMLEQSAIIMAGQDIGPKGGVYHITAKLSARFGANRVINTLLDEQSILGLAIGLAQSGYLPIPEIQFLAYLHNAQDQIRGEAATLSFFSQGQFTNPMIVRIAGLAYQRGFGGHFHNDNSLAVLRDIPGLIIACPSTGRDAVLMIRECVRLAREEQRVIAFIEPIALYNQRDLHEPGDKAWCDLYPHPSERASIPLGQIGQHGEGTDIAIITYGNGVFLSHQGAKVLEESYDISCRVIDLRWLAPLNEIALLRAIASCKTALIVDECRRSGSQSEALMSLLSEHAEASLRFSRLTAEDSFIPLGAGATATLPSKDSIIEAARELVTGARHEL